MRLSADSQNLQKRLNFVGGRLRWYCIWAILTFVLVLVNDIITATLAH